VRVRADLPEQVAAALARCAHPSLVFDLARIDANLAALAAAARAADITPLFAAKSFPHAAVRALAAARLAGFDVASPAEVAEIAALAPPGAAGILSVVDPSGRAAGATGGWRGRLIIGCDSVAQVAAAPPGAEIAIRLSASVTARDPAIGAVLDGSGHRRSRFGLDVEPVHLRHAIGALAHAAGDRPVGLHLHHGPVSATTGERFVATARAALAAADAAGVTPRFLDLGGAWHAVADLPGALRAIRAALPGLELFIEPGRLLADGAGFACGRVASVRALDDRRLCVLELSRVCHLRWSQPELVAPPPHTGAGRVTLLAGPTCYEDDVLGEWTLDPAELPVGGRAVVRNVTGYALAWNTGFGGVAPAAVVIVD
jgi:diaminopimelate decarboxylase